jgi:hypothetical protein
MHSNPFIYEATSSGNLDKVGVGIPGGTTDHYAVLFVIAYVLLVFILLFLGFYLAFHIPTAMEYIFRSYCNSDEETGSESDDDDQDESEKSENKKPIQHTTNSDNKLHFYNIEQLTETRECAKETVLRKDQPEIPLIQEFKKPIPVINAWTVESGNKIANKLIHIMSKQERPRVYLISDVHCV